MKTNNPKTANQEKFEAVINIGIEMGVFEDHLMNEDGFDEYTTTAQAIRKALEAAYDAGVTAAINSLRGA